MYSNEAYPDDQGLVLEQKGWNSYHQTKVLLFLSDQAMVMLLLYLRNVRARKHNNTSKQRGKKEYLYYETIVLKYRKLLQISSMTFLPPPPLKDRPVLNNIHCQSQLNVYVVSQKCKLQSDSLSHSRESDC